MPTGLQTLPAATILSDGDKPDTFWRTLQIFNATRIVVALALALLVYLNMHDPKDSWSEGFLSYQLTCSAYLVLAVIFILLTTYYRRHYQLQIVVQIVIDIIAISILYLGTGGAKVGFGMLYLLPLAGGAILAPLSWALFFVAVTTLVLLGQSVYQVLQDEAAASTVQAGLSGAAFFFAVFVINRLANKSMKQEALAKQHSKALRVQLAINRMAIADMGDGLLVVGRDGSILMANPVAERLLGLTIPDENSHQAVSRNLSQQFPQKLADFPTLMPIAEIFSAWSSSGFRSTADAPIFVTLRHGDERSAESASAEWNGAMSVHLKVRFVSVNTRELDEYRAVIFFQDVSEIENQAQQLKLAAMGRLTASVAHEVRNPLAAISYAASLLGEGFNEKIGEQAVSASTASQIRMLKIINDNVARLDRMIEDILKLSRKAQRQTAPILLSPLVIDIVDEFQKMHTLEAEMVQVKMAASDQYRVWFDSMHLREVIVNLLSNAIRYASGRAGSIRLQVISNAAHHLELHVQDDGEPITPEVRAHLFEPFYTTSNKGTGLGLFLARELCLNNGAMLDYEYRQEVMEAKVAKTVESKAQEIKIKEQLEQNSEPFSGRFVITFAANAPL
ncbi:sensor histidine kinase [Glaciimonas soli]|uniref:histidine kinase n=1 Tax=Glaciimonas soli TaxID=2590999 RepID=A0A843YY60_9BURK|nr:ATP-binding protein [Glaciimonas soli]MQR02191.1 two-component sensor histidine kinase [Glaciimonas soli]